MSWDDEEEERRRREEQREREEAERQRQIEKEEWRRREEERERERQCIGGVIRIDGYYEGPRRQHIERHLAERDSVRIDSHKPHPNPWEQGYNQRTRD